LRLEAEVEWRMMDDVRDLEETVLPDDEPTDNGADAPLEEESGRLARIVESVLFAAGAPLGLRKLIDILGASGARPTPKEVLGVIVQLREHYAQGRRGIQLHEVAGGYQFRTARENAEWVRAVFRDKPARLGRATLETLAIVAYKQPVTRAEIEVIRGVDVDGVLSTLLTRRLIKIAGRKEAVGRPLLYATTPEFLETFGLKDLNDLPSLKELGPVTDDDNTEQSAAGTYAEAPTDATADTLAASDPAADACEPIADDGGAAAEDLESRRDRLAPGGGGADSDGARAGERAAGEDPGDEGGSPPRSDHG
jgi:segregation and condensation protein B